MTNYILSRAARHNARDNASEIADTYSDETQRLARQGRGQR